MCREYEHFDILEVAGKCGIKLYSNRGSKVEFKARCPFCGDSSYHLGINRQKERFNCFRCGERGNSVSLYAKVYGVSNKEAFKRLKENGDFQPKYIFVPKTQTETPMRSLADRHDVYYDFLNLLRLNRFHREGLEKRGLCVKDMFQFMYRSVPTDGVFRREVLEKLAKKHNLIGIPGFYIDECGRVQMYLNKYGGMFVPICDSQGYIQGLQIRLDIPENSKEDKFRWFSSRYFPFGAGAKPWVHVVGDTTAKEAVLTEGAMKADVTSVLSDGKLFIAIPGVNAVEYLPEIVRSLGVEKIYEMMDMDKRWNPNVRRAIIKLHDMLDNIGVEYEECLWNPNYKGIDDYSYAKARYMRSELLAA